MKILQVIPYFYPASAFGGPVTVTYQICRELVKRGHEVVVFTSDAKDTTSRLNIEPLKIIDGIKVHYMKNIIINAFKKLKLFITPDLILKSKEEISKFDVIHLHEYRTFQNVLIRHYARKFDIYYTLQPHGSLPRTTKLGIKWLYDVLFGFRLLRDASMIIALNQNEAQQCGDMGIPKEKIKVIPNGIDPSEFADLPPTGSFKKKFGIPEDKKIVLYLGRIHRIKGVDILVKAFTELTDELKDVILVIVGPDDGYLNELLKLVNDLNVKKRVIVSGPLYGVDKLEAYVDADVYVLPSRYETFPMSVLEAYSCGKPVIASRVGGLKDLVIDGVTGLLFEPENIEQLVDSLLFILEDSTRAKQIGVKGNKFIKKNFTIKKVVDKLERLYRDIIS